MMKKLKELFTVGVKDLRTPYDPYPNGKSKNQKPTPPKNYTEQTTLFGKILRDSE